MTSSLIAYGFTAIAFLIGDGVWLGLIARNFYRSQLGELMAPQPSLVAAAAFYLIYVGGIMYFAVSPALASGSWTTALINGAVLGFCAYATYDLTNLAVMRGFPSALAFTDLAWGTVLTAVAATVGFLATRAVS